MTALSDLVGWVLAAFYSLVPNYAFAIIMLGLTFMALVVPLTLKSTRSMLAMQRLQPKLKQLQQQHKNDRLALNQAMTELYKEEGVSPFGSCIPTLIPLPLFYVLYRVIDGLTHVTCTGTGAARACAAVPLYLNHKTAMYKALVHSAKPGTGATIHSLGLDLGASPWTVITKHFGAGQVFGTLFLLLVMISANYYQQIQITNLNPMVRQSQQSNPQMRWMRFFPVVFGLICIRLPSGLVLYYAVSALFRVGQQWMMYRYDPQVKALVAKDAKDLEFIEAHFDDKAPTRQKALAPTGGDRPAGKGAAPLPVLRDRQAANRPTAKSQPRNPAGAQPGAQRNRNRRRRGR